VVTDPDPTGVRSPWRTYRECLLELGDDAGVIVQDDAWLVPDFEERATAAAAECPCRVLCLFVSFQAARAVEAMQRARGESFVKIGLDHFMPVVCVYWPAGAARAVVAYADRMRWGGKVADDAICAGSVNALGLEVWATIPSLVNHLDDVPSLMTDRVGQKRRRAAIFEDTSPWPRGATGTPSG
jgi:hypothetical protein